MQYGSIRPYIAVYFFLLAVLDEGCLQSDQSVGCLRINLKGFFHHLQ